MIRKKGLLQRVPSPSPMLLLGMAVRPFLVSHPMGFEAWVPPHLDT